MDEIKKKILSRTTGPIKPSWHKASLGGRDSDLFQGELITK